eukprot:gene20749-25440_t
MITHVSFSPLLRRVLAVCGLLVFAATLGAQGVATGAIEGRVFDSRRGEYLEKARITVDGQTQEVLTDATGLYRIANVPAGTATLRVFYTGRGVHSETVSV